MTQRTVVMVSGLVIGVLVLGGGILTATMGGIFGQNARMCGSGYSMMTSGSGSTGMMGSTGPGGMTGNGNSGGLWSNCYPSGMMGGATGSSAQGTTLTLAQVQQHVQQYAAQYGTTALAVDEVMEFQNNFYAIVKDRSTGHGAFEVLVNKGSGAVFPEYGPAMMWNTRYGAMRGMMGYAQADGPMTIAPVQATRLATQWLRHNQPGATTETPEQFPGYYTVHILTNGKVTGMLSVNGFTGQVWYHTWHGALIQMKDLHA